MKRTPADVAANIEQIARRAGARVLGVNLEGAEGKGTATSGDNP